MDKTLYEIIEDLLKVNNKTYEDILWIGGKHYEIDFETFKKCALVDGMEDSILEIPFDLVLVGEDFWVDVFIDDIDSGIEDCLYFRQKPRRPEKKKTIKSFSTCLSLESLDDLN